MWSRPCLQEPSAGAGPQELPSRPSSEGVNPGPGPPPQPSLLLNPGQTPTRETLPNGGPQQRGPLYPEALFCCQESEPQQATSAFAESLRWRPRRSAPSLGQEPHASGPGTHTVSSLAWSLEQEARASPGGRALPRCLPELLGTRRRVLRPVARGLREGVWTRTHSKGQEGCLTLSTWLGRLGQVHPAFSRGRLGSNELERGAGHCWEGAVFTPGAVDGEDEPGQLVHLPFLSLRARPSVPPTHTHPRAAPPRAAPIPRLWVQVPSFQAGPRPEGCVTRGCSARQSPGPWGPTCRWAGCDLRLPRPQPCCGSCDFVQRLCESAPRRICSLFQFCLLGDASFRGQAGLCSLRDDLSSSSSCCAPVPPGWVGCPSSLWGCVRE